LSATERGQRRDRPGWVVSSQRKAPTALRPKTGQGGDGKDRDSRTPANYDPDRGEVGGVRGRFSETLLELSGAPAPVGIGNAAGSSGRNS